jgi:hypothetical protein
LRVKLHKLETKDQFGKGGPTTGPRIEFGRDAIELIFKIIIAIEELIEQITN